jgi:hypothetical protein
MERAPVHGFTGSRASALDAGTGPGDVVVIPGRMSRQVLDGDGAGLIGRTDSPTVVLAVAPPATGRRVPSSGGVLAGRT